MSIAAEVAQMILLSLFLFFRFFFPPFFPSERIENAELNISYFSAYTFHEGTHSVCTVSICNKIKAARVLVWA